MRWSRSRCPVPVERRRATRRSGRATARRCRPPERPRPRGHLLDGVGAVHPAQYGRVERLHARATRGSPRRARQASAAARRDIVRVGLEGDFRVGRDRARRARGRSSDPPMAVGLEPGRRSAAEVDRLHSRRRRPRPGGTASQPFLEHRFHEPPGRDLASDRDGEIAVAAAPGAERDVDVEVHSRKYARGALMGGSDPPKHPSQLLLDQPLQLERAQHRQHLARRASRRAPPASRGARAPARAPGPRCARRW